VLDFDVICFDYIKTVSFFVTMVYSTRSYCHVIASSIFTEMYLLKCSADNETYIDE